MVSPEPPARSRAVEDPPFRARIGNRAGVRYGVPGTLSATGPELGMVSPEPRQPGRS
jgi:hypothetical protein